MTIPVVAIEKSASSLVDIYGEAAPVWARERVAEYESDVSREGCKFWSAVEAETVRLLARERAGAEPSRSGALNAFPRFLPV